MGEPIITYKGTDKDKKCRGFQYELGKTAESDGAVRCGDRGLHSCEAPLDVLRYYKPDGQNRYFQAEASGEIARGSESEDSKIASSKLTLKAEIGIPGLVKAQVEWTKEKAQTSSTGDKANAATSGYKANAATSGDWANAATSGDWANAATSGYKANAATSGEGANAATSGDWANAATSGEGANAATSGDWANAATSGDWANAATSGKNCISAALGRFSAAKAANGSWIVLADYDDDGNITTVQAAQIDGETLKADVWYTMKNGHIVEADIGE
jgi:hypothetical protein